MDCIKHYMSGYKSCLDNRIHNLKDNIFEEMS